MIVSSFGFEALAWLLFC